MQTKPALFTLSLLSSFLSSQLCTAAVLADPHTAPVHDTNRAVVAAIDSSTQHPAIAYAIDLGYLQLEAETCLPLGPAQQTITQLYAAKRPLSTAEAATLSFSWRQIQHYRAAAGKAGASAICYYVAR